MTSVNIIRIDIYSEHSTYICEHSAYRVGEDTVKKYLR